MRALAAFAASLALAACVATPPAATSVAPIEVMVIGSWHMAGASSDIAAVKSDDVLAPARQAELAAAAAALAAFKPTVIAVERITSAPGYADPVFAAFTLAELGANPDERVQLAYRLASVAGVTRVYGVDEQPSDGEPDYFPFDKVAAQAEASGRSDKLNAMIEDAQAMTARFSAQQAGASMARLLIIANTGEMSSPDFYYRLFDFDAGESQPGAELQGYWFMRNAKIFSKIAQVAKPGDRVVVVYGAGHKYWLDHFAAHTPGFASVSPVPFLERAAR